MNILLLEDDLGDVVYMQEVLKEHKVVVSSRFPSSKEDISSFDTVIADYYLENGEISEFLKGIDGVSCPPLVLVSGRRESIEGFCLPEGVQGVFLSKNDRLKECLISYLEQLESSLANQQRREDQLLQLGYKNLLLSLLHDLRNDLGVVHLIDSLRESGEARVENCLGDLLSATKFAIQRIEELTNFMSAENSSEHSSMSGVFGELSQSPLIKAHLDKMTIVGDKNEPIFHIPKHFLKIIMKNLIENSVKHNEQTLNLEIRVKCVIKSNGVYIEYGDNGAGIPSDKIDQLMINMVNSDSGIGLGMVLIKRLVESFGGEINLLSTPRGAGFLLTIFFGDKA